MNKEIEIRKRTPEELEEQIIELNNEIALLKHDNRVLEEQLKDENTYHEEASKWYKEAFKQLDNWHKLKEWIKEDTEVAETNFEMGRCFNMYDLLNKMQEIEGGVDNE